LNTSETNILLCNNSPYSRNANGLSKHLFYHLNRLKQPGLLILASAKMDFYLYRDRHNKDKTVTTAVQCYHSSCS